MLKDRVSFTKKGWSIYNVEFLFDSIAFILFAFVHIALAYFGLLESLTSLASITIPFIGFYAIHKIYGRYIYLLGLFVHILFLQLILPVQWMSPLWIGLSTLIGLGVFAIFQHYLSIRFPYFLMPLITICILSQWIPMQSVTLDPSQFPWSWIEGWSMLDYLGLFGMNHFSLLESFSIYGLSLGSLFIFRRLISIQALIWIIIISIIPYYKDLNSIPLPNLLIHCNIFFLAYLLPGRSIYSSFWIHQPIWIVLCAVQFILTFTNTTQIPLGFLMLLFFMLEGIFLKFFYASRPMKGNIE